MKTYSQAELQTILEKHKLWLDSNRKKGERANLSEAILSDIKLESYVYLSTDNYETFIKQSNLEKFFVYRYNHYWVALETRFSELNKILAENKEILEIRK